MSDLTWAILAMLVVSIGFFQLGRHCGGSSSRPFRLQVQVMSLLAMFAYMGFLWNRPLLATILPGSGLIILGNWLPIWAAFFIGIYVASPEIAKARKAVLTLSTLILAAYSAIAPVTGEPPECSTTNTSRSLVYQTNPFSCSAACASSLLRIHNIEATEDELSRLCLTRRGTHWMGVYRGLKIKTAGSGWDVVAEPFSRDSLEKNSLYPCILSLDLDVSGFGAEVDHGFHSDTGHSVVFLGGAERGYISVFDPSPDFGPEEWDDRILSCVRSGVILRLVPSSPNSQSVLTVQRRLLKARNANSIAQL